MISPNQLAATFLIGGMSKRLDFTVNHTSNLMDEVLHLIPCGWKNVLKSVESDFESKLI